MKLRVISTESKLRIGRRTPVLSTHESALRAKLVYRAWVNRSNRSSNGNTLLIPGPDQDEHASIVVVVADQEPRELGTCRLGERPGDLGQVRCLPRPA